MLVIIHQTYVSKISQLLFLLSVHPILLHKIIIPKFKSDNLYPKKAYANSIIKLVLRYVSRVSLCYISLNNFPIFQILHFYIFTFRGNSFQVFLFVRSPLFSSNESLVRRFDFFSKSSFDISTQNSTQINFIPIDSKYFFRFFFLSKLFQNSRNFFIKNIFVSKNTHKKFFPFLFEIKHKCEKKHFWVLCHTKNWIEFWNESFNDFKREEKKSQLYFRPIPIG